MKAIVQTKYGDPKHVLEVREVDDPVVGPGQVLVRVRAATVHADVWHVVTGLPYALRAMGSGLFGPKDRVPGTDLAGVVTKVGEGVRRLEVGDSVFGESLPGMQWKNGGTFAEYAAVPANTLAKKPDGVGFAEAASVATSGYIALSNLRGDAAVQSGQHILINGAGGYVGTIALQAAKARGAQVTAVDTGGKLGMLRELGADHVIDYTEQDPTRVEARYDLVYDVASTLRLSDCKRVLAPEGVYVVIGHDHYGERGRKVLGSLPQMFGLMARAPFDRNLPSVDTSVAPKDEVMGELQKLLEHGALTPVVDQTFGLDDIHDAMDYLLSGRAMGRIVLTP